MAVKGAEVPSVRFRSVGLQTPLRAMPKNH